MNRIAIAFVLSFFPLLSLAQSVGIKAGISSFSKLEDLWGPGQSLGITGSAPVSEAWSAITEFNYTEFSPNETGFLRSFGSNEHTDNKLVKGLLIQLSQFRFGAQYEVPETGIRFNSGAGLAKRVLTKGSVSGSTLDPINSESISWILFGGVDYAFENLIISGSFSQFYFDNIESRTLSLSIGWMFFFNGDNQ